MRKADVNDPYNLQRFVDAQEPEYEKVCSEILDGCKSGHWMWFIFPQIKGLGTSYLANKFAISSLHEAEAYSRHPILGPRLRESTRLVNLLEGRSIQEIFGGIDSMKFRSSMTLFTQATSDNEVFRNALQKYFAGEVDHLTLERL